MPVPPGHTLGCYRIESQLGSGGMGEVYRATDTKLGRVVALKLLPASFASDPERLVRFQREARTLAALNHPHIAQVYDAGSDAAASTAYIAMELVEGEDLSQRIARGPVPIAETLAIARQLVQALDAAHERGIVHRDLKPANIKLREDGTVKVLDFGLAKATDPNAAQAGSEDPASTAPTILANSPTTMSPATTSMGMILGTAGYMSPEQAKGRPVDKRADIWAFGVVLYEMLTGKALFAGETVTEVVAAVIREDISLDALPPDTPRSLRLALERCLERDPRKRLRDIGDLNLDEAGPTDPRAVAKPTPLLLRIAPWLVAAAGIFGTWLLTRPADVAPPAPIRTSIDLPPGTNLPLRDRAIALSPDGRRLAIVLVDSTTQRSQLHIRSLDSGLFTPLEGTVGAIYPFWSPDGTSVGFFADRELRRFDYPNGPVRTITNATEGRGATWKADDSIVFVAATPPDFQKTGVYRVRADGRAPAESIGSEVAKEFTLHSPRFLPDGSGFFLSRRHVERKESPHWLVMDARTGATSRVIDAAASEAQYAAPGWLLYVANELLMAQAFDPVTRTASGRAQAIADRVDTDALRATANMTQAAGTLIFHQTPPPPMRRLTWYDIDGRQIATVGEPAAYSEISVSPDGRRAVVTQSDLQLWMIDLESGTRSPFYAGPDRKGADIVWSPDGREVAFRELATHLIIVQQADNPSVSRKIGSVGVRSAWAPSAWTPDGKVHHPEFGPGAARKRSGGSGGGRIR